MIEKDNILPDFDPKKTNNPFKVPEGYFNTLLPRIQDKIEAGKKSRGLAWHLSFKPIFRLSFFIAGITFIIIIGLNELRPLWVSKEKTEKSIDELANYLDSQVFTLDDLTLLSASDVSKNESKASEPNDTINYLMNSDVGVEEIVIEL